MEDDSPTEKEYDKTGGKTFTEKENEMNYILQTQVEEGPTTCSEPRTATYFIFYYPFIDTVYRHKETQRNTLSSYSQPDPLIASTSRLIS